VDIIRLPLRGRCRGNGRFPYTEMTGVRQDHR